MSTDIRLALYCDVGNCIKVSVPDLGDKEFCLFNFTVYNDGMLSLQQVLEGRICTFFLNLLSKRKSCLYSIYLLGGYYDLKQNLKQKIKYILEISIHKSLNNFLWHSI